MAVTFDGENKLIIVVGGTSTLDVKADVYSQWKAWVVQSDNAKYEQAISAVGGDEITSGSLYLGSTFFLENGWRLRPAEENVVLTIDGNLYTRDGSSPFVSTLGTYNVLINLRTSNLVDTIATGGGGGYTPSQVADAVWQKDIPASPASGTYGHWISKRLMTLAEYLGLN